MKEKFTMNEKWKEMTSMQKAGFIILCLGEAMDYWQKNKKWAWLFIGAGAIAMVASFWNCACCNYITFKRGNGFDCSLSFLYRNL